MHVMAVDAIEESNDSDGGCIAIQAKSEIKNEDPVIPLPKKNEVRIDFPNFIMIRARPLDHPCVARSNQGDNDNEPLVLLSIILKVDPHVRVVPQSAC